MIVGATRFDVWRRFLVLTLSVGCGGFLVGCLSISIPPSSSVAERGGRATNVTKIGPWYLIGTASVAPGSPRSWPAMHEVQRCGGNDLRIEIRTVDGILDHDGDTALCAAVYKAVRYVASGVGRTGSTVTFRVYLLPKGVEIRRQQAGWTTKDEVAVDYAFPMNADESSTATVVSAVAHEAFHLYGALASLPASVRKDETLAYTFGACAQLNAIGWLRSQDMPSAAFSDSSPGISRAALISSRAGVALIEQFRPYFDAAGEIRSPSQRADAALDFCRQTLGSRARYNGVDNGSGSTFDDPTNAIDRPVQRPPAHR